MHAPALLDLLSLSAEIVPRAEPDYVRRREAFVIRCSAQPLGADYENGRTWRLANRCAKRATDTGTCAVA